MWRGGEMYRLVSGRSNIAVKWLVVGGRKWLVEAQPCDLAGTGYHSARNHMHGKYGGVQ